MDMIDSRATYQEHANQSTILALHSLQSHSYVLLTLQRLSNVDIPKFLSTLLRALAVIQEKVSIVFLTHPKTKQRLVSLSLTGFVQRLNNILFLEPVGYKDSQLLKESLFVIANSSRIQEESTFLGISCLTVRENTEHPITIARGTNTLVGRNSEKIIDEALLILDGKGKRGIIPELWDGKTAERILEVLRCRADGVTP